VAATRGDEFRAEFFADVGNVNVQKIGKRTFVLVKQMLVKLRARDDFAAMRRGCPFINASAEFMKASLTTEFCLIVNMTNKMSATAKKESPISG